VEFSEVEHSNWDETSKKSLPVRVKKNESVRLIDVEKLSTEDDTEHCACVHSIAQLFTFDGRNEKKEKCFPSMTRYASSNEAIAIAPLCHHQCVVVMKPRFDVESCKHCFDWYYSTLTVLARQTQRVFSRLKAKVETHGDLVISISSPYPYSSSCHAHCTFFLFHSFIPFVT
jgi:hypothetical protein